VRVAYTVPNASAQQARGVDVHGLFPMLVAALRPGASPPSDETGTQRHAVTCANPRCVIA
jgi:hypothetical protein